MTNRLLLLSVMLTLSACRHMPTPRQPVPSLEEIQRAAPDGGLVLITLRDKDQPQRVTSYLVDVRQDRIVARRDGVTAEQMAAPDSPDMKSASQMKTSFLMASVLVPTDCKPPEDQTGCAPDPGAWNGDPVGGTGGGGDPTGHDPDRLVRSLAQYTFWSLRQVRLPHLVKPVQVQNPTHGGR